MELKLMMEKLGAPQTHLGLKSMIQEVDEDFDSKLSFREVSPSRGHSQPATPQHWVALRGSQGVLGRRPPAWASWVPEL